LDPTHSQNHGSTQILFGPDGREVITRFELSHGFVNVLDPRDERQGRNYRHGARMHQDGISIGFVVRHVPNYREFNPNTNEMVLNEEEEELLRKRQKFNDKRNFVKGSYDEKGKFIPGSFYKQLLGHERCETKNCERCSRYQRSDLIGRMRRYIGMKRKKHYEQICISVSWNFCKWMKVIGVMFYQNCIIYIY
jgi:hypothetical protein